MSYALILAAAAIAGHQSSPQKHSSPGMPTVCKLEGVFDGQTQQNAFTYFVPKGWTSHSNLTWDARQAGSFHVAVSATTPDQQYEVTQIGDEGYLYKITYPFDGGPPLVYNIKVHHASEYLRVLFDQMAKSNGFSDVEVMDEVNAPLPDEKIPGWLKKPINNALFTDVPLNETGFLQVKFSRGGQSMVAMLGTSIMGTLGHPNHPIGRPSGASEGGNFKVGPTTYLIMPADAPKQKQREMQIIAGSIQMTPKFRSYTRELVDKLIRIRIGAAAAGQKYADATFHERTMSQFNEQMHMKDAYSHAFCNYVSDLQDYKDAEGHIVTAPANYKYAWSDGKGNYMLNDDPQVNLRGVGSGDWKLMQKAKIGE